MNHSKIPVLLAYWDDFDFGIIRDVNCCFFLSSRLQHQFGLSGALPQRNHSSQMLNDQSK